MQRGQGPPPPPAPARTPFGGPEVCLGRKPAKKYRRRAMPRTPVEGHHGALESSSCPPVIALAGLTAGPIGPPAGQPGLSEQGLPSNGAPFNRKVTLGITGLSWPRAPIGARVCHLDVDSACPRGASAPKGRTVRPLRRYASWVKNAPSGQLREPLTGAAADDPQPLRPGGRFNDARPRRPRAKRQSGLGGNP